MVVFSASMNFPLKVTLGCLVAGSLASCAAVKDRMADAKKRTGEMVANVKLPELAETPLARLMPAGGLKIVEPRKEALEEMPSGHERALAYRAEKRRGFWFFGGPVDFEEPPLPAPGSELDGGLLPPKQP
jgi:hypothetical protein